MSETITAPERGKHSDEETARQVGRIAGKLAERAARIKESAPIDENGNTVRPRPLSGLYAHREPSFAATEHFQDGNRVMASTEQFGSKTVVALEKDEAGGQNRVDLQFSEGDSTAIYAETDGNGNGSKQKVPASELREPAAEALATMRGQLAEHELASQQVAAERAHELPG